MAASMRTINTVRLNKGFSNGFWYVLLVGLGCMIADIFYMLVVYIGIVQFLNSTTLQLFLWLFGGFLLIYTGMKKILTANKIHLFPTKRINSLKKCVMTGFIISISSPLSILFWLGIYGSILAKTALTYGTDELLLYSSMIFVGLGIWNLFIATLTSGFRISLNFKMIILISIVSGMSLIGIGVYLGFEGLLTLLK